MKEKNKEVNYYIWDGNDIQAKVYADISLPDGSNLHRTEIGNTTIQKGDAITVYNGANLQVYTRSGKGYELEFPYGKISLYGQFPVGGIVLNAEQSIFVKHVKTPKHEFEDRVKIQENRVLPKIEELKKIFILEETNRREQAYERKKIFENQRQKKLSQVLDQVESYFSQKSKIKP